MADDPYPLRLRRLVLVRHGETVGESSIRYHGRNDVALSDLGREQMRRAAAALASHSWDAVYTSTRQRAREGAAIIAAHPSALAVEGFDEIHFGEWEGLTKEEIAARDPDLYDRWHPADGAFAYPGGESIREFRARVVAEWQRLAATMPPQVLVVAHKGVIATVIAEVLQLSDVQRADWRIDLGSIHVLVRDDGGWRAELSSAISHLAGLY